MYIPQNSRNNSVDINSVLSNGFALDSSLDAELSLHNVTSESWSNPNSEALFTNGSPYAAYPPPHQQSGSSPTSTATVATPPTNELSLPFTPSAINNGNSTGIYAPSVVLRRPSMDTSAGIKTATTTNYFSDITNTPFDQHASPTANNSTTPSPLHDFGNLDLNFNEKGALIIDGPVCLMNGDTVEYVDHLLPVSPEASSCGGGGASGVSAPNSPILFDVSPAFDQNTSNTSNTSNTTNNMNTPEGLDYLQMSTWENNVSSLSPSSSPPPQMKSNQYQQPQPQPQQQNLNTFTDPFTSPSSSSTTPMTPLVSNNGDIDQPQPSVPTHRRSAHNAVEKKYRNNINDRIAELKNAVPALRHARVKKEPAAATTTCHDEDDDTDEPVFMDGVAVATKLNKATILQKATEYVFHLQHANNELKQDIDALLTTIANHVPNGQQLAQQYRQHVLQRDALHQQQLLYREKSKRQKRPGHHHYQHHPDHHQHRQHHSPLKGENRSLNQQHPQFLYLQQQQQQQQ